MSNETNTRTATPTASPLTAQGTQQPVMVKRIGKTTYRVKLHFSETSKETMTDKIKRLILNDCAKEFEQSEKISETPLTKRIRGFASVRNGERGQGGYAGGCRAARAGNSGNAGSDD